VAKEVKSAEMDELFTFIGYKKKHIYLITIVDHQTHCFLGWKLAWEHTEALMKEIVDEAIKAKWYYSDAFQSMASFGITMAAMKYPKARPKRIRSKPIMPRSDNIWPD
jgi:hypothetical protein